MKAMNSLIRISTHEVENLQKRLAEIVDRRTACELRMVVMEAEGEAELQRARQDADAGWYLVGFREGLKLRRAAVQAEIDTITIEEAGARDALAEAFEALKKYEHVREATRTAARKEAEKRETAALDELGLRRAAGR
ncbi:flagellar export protein FliJ [Caulobacter mirabilis]|uniref:Flagellar export protein FliJ n=1 Tax=Caulobacter mirabilis TaxID=69666 RepID=A0A2D2AV32_9CAUL|nr:flagellar export protein FliJ [Caulobacter mirabilis]ATQ41853.1 flagellar export protein FliJ [Caulobacter mirabilis]